VPQKNAFIIDEDRDFALMVAAALRTDGLKVSISEGDRDPLDEIRAERPDIVLVRAESSGKESGYTLCSRVKRNKRTMATPVFLYTSKDTDQIIETHKTKETRADEYLIVPAEPPYPLDELRDRVRNVLFPPGGLEKPPPLPPAPKEEVKPVTQEDTAFIEKVMDSLSTNVSEEPAPAIPLKREGSTIGRRVTTADAKLDMLRDKLRQREIELARVMEMYRGKEREYHQFNERLVEKDVEAQSLKMTIEELNAQLHEFRTELERRTNEFNSSFELLLEEKVNRENELIQVVAGKEKDIADLKGDLRDEQDTAKTRIRALEDSLAETDQKREHAEAEIVSLKGTVDKREGAIRGLEQDLEDAAHREKQLQDLRDQQMSKILGHEERMLGLEDVILELRGDLSSLREDHNSTRDELADEIAARDAIIEGLGSDFAEADAQFADLTARFEMKERTLAETEAAKLAVETERTDLSARLSQTIEVRDGLSRDLHETQLRVEATTAENERLLRDGEKLERDLRGIIAQKEEAIADLDRSMKALRREFDETEASLRTEIERLESARISVEQELAGVEAELTEKLNQATRTIAERDESLAALRGELKGSQNEVRQNLDRISSLEAELAEEMQRFRQLEGEAKAEKDRLNLEIRRYDSELSSARAEAEALEAELRDQIMQLGIDLASKGDEIDTLRVDLGSEKRERASAERTGAQLQEQLKHTSGELAETNKNLRQTERDLGSTRETLATREGRIAELIEALKEEKEDRIESQGQLKTLRADYDARASEMGRLQGRIAVLDDNLTSLRVEQEELESALEETRQELVNHRSMLATARTEVSERSQRLEETSRTLARREQEIAEYRDQLTQVTGDRDRVTKDRDQLKNDRDRLTDDLARSTKRGQDLSAELDELNERASELEAEVESRGGRIEVLTQNLTSTEDARQQVDRARVQLTTDLARAEEAFSRLQSEMERARAEWNEARTALTRERDGVRARMAELGAELDTVRDERDQALHARALLEEQSNARGKMDAQAQQALERQLEQAKAQHATKSEEMRSELEAREAHNRALDREVQSTREELESQRAANERATRDIESLQRALDELSDEASTNQAMAGREKQAFEAKVALLEQQLSTSQKNGAETKSTLEAQLGSLQQHSESLEKERERLRQEAVSIGERLEEATRRAAHLAQEKHQVEEKRAAEVGERDRSITDLRKQLEERRVENVKASNDFTQRLSEMQAKAARLEEAIDDVRAEKDEQETKYLREFEEAQENFLKQRGEKDTAHQRELEELRAQKIELTRQLKTSQLAAQRLTDRVQKLETERPAQRTGAEQEFDSFLKQLEDTAGSKLPVPAPASSLPATKKPAATTPPLPSMKALPTQPPKPVKAEPISSNEATLPPPAPQVQAIQGLEGMEDEKTQSQLDIVHQPGKSSPQVSAGTVAAGTTPKPRTPPPPPTRRPLPKLDPKTAGKSGNNASLTEGLTTDEPGEDFMSSFDRNFDSIKKS
jgi:chromosome segregation ATPase